MNEGIAETLIRVSKISKRPDKIEALRRGYSKQLHLIVQACFDPQWEWLLPETSAPIDKQVSKEHDFQGVLKSQIRKLHIYRKGGGYDNMEPAKRESLYIEWLEQMDPDDALMIDSIRINKKFPFDTISTKLMKDAFPGIFAEFKNG